MLSAQQINQASATKLYAYLNAAKVLPPANLGALLARAEKIQKTSLPLNKKDSRCFEKVKWAITQISAAQMKSKKNEFKGNFDYEQLPDDLRLYILSFLTFNELNDALTVSHDFMQDALSAPNRSAYAYHDKLHLAVKLAKINRIQNEKFYSFEKAFTSLSKLPSKTKNKYIEESLAFFEVKNYTTREYCYLSDTASQIRFALLIISALLAFIGSIMTSILLYSLSDNKWQVDSGIAVFIAMSALVCSLPITAVCTIFGMQAQGQHVEKQKLAYAQKTLPRFFNQKVPKIEELNEVVVNKL